MDVDSIQELLAQKPQKTRYVDPPRTMGDYVRKRRLELGWGAIQLAHMLHVSTETIFNWEKGRSFPEIRFMARIIEFLGYTPELFNRDTTGQKIIAYRHVWGMSQWVLALALKVDPGTLGWWEHDKGCRRASSK